MQNIPYFHYSTVGGPLGVAFIVIGAIGLVALGLNIAFSFRSTNPKRNEKSLSVFSHVMEDYTLAVGAIALIVGMIGIATTSLVNMQVQKGELRTWANENYSLNLSEQRASDLYKDAFGKYSVHDGIHVKQDGRTVRIILKQVEGNDYKLEVTNE